MKTHKHQFLRRSCLAGLMLVVLTGFASHAQVTVVSDDCTAVNTASGFALGQGINSGVYPPFSNRITGTVAANLRYYKSGGERANSKYLIDDNRIRVSTETKIGRFVLSTDGSTPFNYARALGTLGASPSDPAVYEVRISMQNEASSTARLSFGLSTSEGDANNWDFGVQINHADAAHDYYTVHRRIHSASSGAGSLNNPIATAPPGSWKTMVHFLIRVTDAGAESGANFNSRVQVSMDDGNTWVYDTSTDSALPNGFRFDAPGRVFIWDQASNGSGTCYYDNFSVISIHAPPPPPERVWTGGGTDNLWSTSVNWGGTVPSEGEPLLFGLAARQANFNDLPELLTPTLTFTNDGFVLDGNTLSVGESINNLAGSNTIQLSLDLPVSGAKHWQIAAGSVLHLSGISSWTTAGDHIMDGGGTLHLTGALDISANNPPWVLREGRFVIAGGSFSSLGGFRIGSSASTLAPIETVVTDGGSITLSVPAANLRVGDGAPHAPSRLIVENGTVSLQGGLIGLPYVGECTGEVWQTGGWVKDAYVVYSYHAAGHGTYAVTNGILEPFQIRRDSAGGTAIMRFNNAQLRPALGADGANFMRGLDEAEIQSGGLTIDATTDVTIAQALSGAGGLTKINFYTVALTGANSYAGNTLIQEGKLGLPTTQTNAAGIQVAAGAELEVTRVTTASTLTAGSLNLGTSTLNFDLGAFPNPTVPVMRVNTLSPSGGAGSVSINISGGLGLSLGQFPLVKYDGAIGGAGYSAFTLGALPPGVGATLVNNTANASIDLKITAAPGFRWTGANGNSWDYWTMNWVDLGAGTPAIYTDGQPTYFLDGATTGLVDLTGNFTPADLVISNNSLTYVFGGFGNLSVPRLTKSGTAAFTRVDGGADVIGEIQLDAGIYCSSNTYDATLASVLSDTTAGLGTFVKSGPAVLTVSGNNRAFNGIVEVREGTLKAGNSLALGSAQGPTIITNGGTLDVNDLYLGDEPVVVSGAGVGGVGAIIDSTTGGDVLPALKDVTLAGDTTFGSPNGGRWDLRVRQNTGAGPGLRGNGFNLTKVGPGMVSIASQRNLGAATPYWEMNLGDVTVQAGTLALAESLSLGNPAKQIIVQPGAILQFYDLGLTNPIWRTIVLTDARLNSHGSETHTNVINGGFQLTGANTFWAEQAHLIVNGPLAGSGTLGFAAGGSGTLILNGPSPYTGTVIVTNGVIGGTASLAGDLTLLGGTCAPGWPRGVPGTLSANGNVTLAGVTVMELAPHLSPNCDRIVAGGTLTCGGALIVILAADAPAPQRGDVYQLFSSNSRGTFSSVNLPALPAGLDWNTDELYSQGRIAVVGPGISFQPPHITDGHLILSGDGGIASGTYKILTSLQVAAPLSEWTIHTTGTFSAGGAFSNALPINPAEPERYYRIQQP
ncbi:MAG: hypothetical protein KA236_13520 [Verrucomicrobia bacterium]|nr:hypothetical protein [Verrucomicrobiota bacterium]